MTPNQKTYRALLDRQSKHRQRMAEISALAADKITPEIRTELDTIETGTPDLERQIRAARGRARRRRKIVGYHDHRRRRRNPRAHRIAVESAIDQLFDGGGARPNAERCRA